MHINNINELPIGNIIIHTVQGDEKPENVFIIKDTKFPPSEVEIQSALLFFIAEVNDKYIPFIYYIVKFGNSDDFIYDIVMYIDKELNLEDLLLDQRKYYFMDDATQEVEDTIKIKKIFVEQIEKTVNDNVKNGLKSFDNTKNSDKATLEDFINFHNSNLFLEFIGNKQNAIERIKKLCEYGTIIDLSVSKDNKRLIITNQISS